MLYTQRFQQIVNLPFDTKVTMHQVNSLELSVFRPSVPPPRFKNYDPRRNFQIWLHDGPRSFKPNHLRVMIDLHLRVRSRPDLKAQLAQSIDSVFYGQDPDKIALKFENETFEHFLNPLSVTLHLSQLFIIEQAYGYNRESKYEPATLFYQGWVRQVIDSDKEIDNLIMSIANRQPPSAKYTVADDKNSKKYTVARKPLWWLS